MPSTRDGADRVLAALHTESELLGSTRVPHLAGDDVYVKNGYLKEVP